MKEYLKSVQTKTASSLQQPYMAALKSCEEDICLLQKQYGRCSLLRAITACLVVAAIPLGIFVQVYVGLALGIAGLLAFILLVARHNGIDRKLQYQRARKAVLERYISRFSHKWRNFSDNGEEFLEETFPQGKDLDLFGSGSLYQYICAAHTPRGRKSLADWLKGKKTAGEDMLAMRQQAVAELLKKREFCLEIETLAQPVMASSKNGKDDMESPVFTSHSGAKIGYVLAWLMPVVTLFFLLSALVGVQTTWNLQIFGVLFGLQIMAAMIAYGRNSRILHPVDAFSRWIVPYQGMLSRMERETFENPLLQEMQRTLREKGETAKAFSSLKKLGDAVNSRHNALAFLLYNGLFLWDFHCCHRFREWWQQYGEAIPQWLETAGELEALISLSVLPAVREHTCYPQIKNAVEPFLHCRHLQHPLIHADTSVGNDFDLYRHTCIITGSNMSGKTTFLRSIGINLFLAYAGGAVLADEFEAAEMAVFTSMRLSDNVGEGISTFYAELLRIKEIIDYSHQGKPMIALVDEIYRGTNSQDRIFSAAETLRRLSKPQAMTIVTTHDFELCDLEKERSLDAVNYHFSEYYQHDEILFDYVIRPGRCQTTNARQLLRLVGIVD